MSSEYVSAELRRLVKSRADSLCEYCLLHADDTFFGCEVDHIISIKHGGLTREENLAYACLFCNRNKGSDIASIIPGTNPHRQPVNAFRVVSEAYSTFKNVAFPSPGA